MQIFGNYVGRCGPIAGEMGRAGAAPAEGGSGIVAPSRAWSARGRYGARGETTRYGAAAEGILLVD